MNRLVIVSPDRVGPHLAGVGIRYVEIARSLADQYEVTLAAPEGSEPVDVPAHLVTYDPVRPQRLLTGLPADAALLSPVLWPSVMTRLRGRVRRWVVDLYDPELFETLELVRGRMSLEREARVRFLLDSLRTGLLLGDAFVCASERQRDLWLGALMAAGRLTSTAYAADATLRTTIDVVPFGLPPESPAPAESSVLKGRVAGIGADDQVVLWAGGMWDWLDPITAVRAMDLLRARAPRARLVFLGGAAPTQDSRSERSSGAAAAHARSEARRLGLEGTTVFFHDWVPYERRSAYLLEADAGLTLHGELVEARYAFRTRLLDHIWTGLPTVATAGDELGETLADAGVGVTVAPGDGAGVAAALQACLAAERGERAESFQALRERFAWPVVTRPLRALLDSGAASHPRRLAATPYRLRDALLWRLLRTLPRR